MRKRRMIFFFPFSCIDVNARRNVLTNGSISNALALQSRPPACGSVLNAAKRERNPEIHLLNIICALFKKPRYVIFIYGLCHIIRSWMSTVAFHVVPLLENFPQTISAVCRSGKLVVYLSAFPWFTLAHMYVSPSNQRVDIYLSGQTKVHCLFTRKQTTVPPFSWSKFANRLLEKRSPRLFTLMD